ncbi:ninein-like protein [Huso huso]|uniref:Ninein-like protein n=1 Tax=Huso huso TaxID=61971 RepID=A0ABR0ZYE3_HUSHU
MTREATACNGMDEAEQNRYVSQLKGVFDSCDTTGTGYLDQEELTELCHKLHLEAHVPVLLKTLLGTDHYARVNFEEFKEGFVAVLSNSLELSTSEDESSYLEPAVPEEVKPKYVKGTKRYGRRSQPELPDSEVEITADSEEPLLYKPTDLFLPGSRRAQLRRSTSLESVESLKSDEETASSKEPQNETFEAQGQMRTWNPDVLDSPRQTSSPRVDSIDVSDSQVQAIWAELGVGGSGYLSRQELSVVCDNIGLTDLHAEELDDLFRKLDKNRNGRVSLSEFQRGLFRHSPLSAHASSTPCKPRLKRALHQAFEESPHRTATPSLLCTITGPRLLSCINDGTGYVNPEQVISIWREEGISNSKEILQTLEFRLDEKLNLSELTLALDNELLVSRNGLHQAALVSYKNEIQFLQGQVEQSCKERDKVKADLEKAEKRTLQLAREVDDHHAAMEHLNDSKVKDLEQDYKEKLSTLRSEMDKERELIMQQTNKQRAKLEEEIDLLRANDAILQEEVAVTTKENSRLEKEVDELVEKLADSQKTVSKLQKDLDLMLMEKFGSLDPHNTELFNQEERFAEIIKEFEQQCRELRDRNDELQSELELLRAQVQDRRSRHSLRNNKPLRIEADSRVPPTDSDSGTASVSAAAVNFYERNIVLMNRNVELERKNIEQDFKIEISELEEQKAELEEKCERLQGVIAELREQLQRPGQSQDLEKRFHQERADMEQYYAKEITGLAERLNKEKNQLELELHEKHEEEMVQLRKEAADLEQRLSQMETQHAEAQHVFLQQNHKLQKLQEKFSQEKHQWEVKERDRFEEYRKEKLRTEEKMNEEQVRICNNEVLQLKARLKSEEDDKERLLEKEKIQSSRCEQLQIHLKTQEEVLTLLRRKKQDLLDKLKQRELDVVEQNLKLQFEVKDKEGLLEEITKHIHLCQQLSSGLVEKAAVTKETTKHLLQLQHMDPLVLEHGVQLDSEVKERGQLKTKLKEKLDILKHNLMLLKDHMSTIQQLSAKLKDKEEEVFRLRKQAGDLSGLLQQREQEAQTQMHQVKEEFEMEKNKLKDQLLQMEKLVTKLEAVSGEGRTHRAQLQGVTEENAALKGKLAICQQDVQKLEVDVNRQRKQTEQMKSEKEMMQSEVKLLFKENTRYRDEVFEISTRNLQLSSENADLNAKIKADQSTIQLLNERLAQISLQKEEEAVVTRQLQEASGRLEREQLQQQSGWQRDKELMEQELQISKEKLQRLKEVESEFSSLTLKHQWLEQDKESLVKELEEQNEKIERLETALQNVSDQADELRSALQAANQDKGSLTKETVIKQKILQEAEDKIKQLEMNVQRLRQEKEQLQTSYRQADEQETLTLRKECESLHSQLQQCQHKIELIHAQESELQRVNQECQTLRRKQTQLETDLVEAQDQLLEASTTLTLAQSQHVREVQQLKEQAGAAVPRDQLAQLQSQLAEEEHRGQRLQEQINIQAEQASKQMALQQEQYKQVLKQMEERMEEVEAKLKNLRMVLQEKVTQLKEQLANNAKSNVLLKDLYVENSQLMKALQVTEQRQKSAEKKNFIMEEKIAALNKLLCKITPASLTV